MLNLEDLMFVYEDGFNLAIKDLGDKYKPSKKTITKKEQSLEEYRSLINEISKIVNNRYGVAS